MLRILLCEDDLGQRAHIESVVRKYIAATNCETELTLSSGNPADVLDYLKAHPDQRGLYFLDIDLQHDEMDGIALGAKIRELDPFAKIVFITTHAELAHLTFKHKISAMDYIVKERPEEVGARVAACISAAYKRYLKEKSEQMAYFTVDANGEVWRIPHDDILFFETHPSIHHKILLYTENSKTDFRGFLKEIEKLVPALYRCHKSFLVNPSKITRIDRSTREAEMVNGKRIPIAEKKMSDLLKIIEDK